MTPAQRVDKLASALQQRGALQLPPTGRREEAEVFETTVTRARLDGEIDALARANAKAAAPERYSIPESVFDRLRVSEAMRFEDNDVTFESGVAEGSVEDYLLNELVAPRKRDAIRSLVRQVPGTYRRLLIADRGAELIADEWIYILPQAVDAKMITVHFQYSDE